MVQLTIQQAFDLALQHHRSGRLPEADRLYRQVINLQPEHVGALHYLGVMSHQMGHSDVAIDLIRRSITHNPDLPEAHNNLGLALQANGQLDEAIAAFRRALALKSGNPAALYNLGVALQAKGLLDEAIAHYEQAIIARPDYVQAHGSLGDVLRESGRPEEAIAAFRRAIELSPNLPEAHSNLGVVLKDMGHLDEAIASYRQALRLKSDLPVAHHNLALSLLARGDLCEGWEEFEWRWKFHDFTSSRRNFTQPQWDGCPLEDRRLLVHTEQGYGDSLHFIRYLPLLAPQSGNIIIECQPELERIFQTLPGRFQVIVRKKPLPDFDLHCPLLSLPKVFKTTLQSIPAGVPYLFPASPLLQSWRQKLNVSARSFNVALAWAGSPVYKGDRTRSLRLDRLAPLANVHGATFYSVQKGNAERQADQPPSGLRLINLAPELNDFADTAAVMCLMDMIITTDTSVAHLAGALGRPVWVMLQSVPDWRWLSDRTDNPWYPSMRLFRQTSRGDWDDVIHRVADALSIRTKECV